MGLLIRQDSYALTVKATCQFFRAELRACSVLGASLRPKLCEYLDERTCSFKRDFLTDPAGVIKIWTSEQYMAEFEPRVEYNADGSVRQLPTFAALRHAIQREESPL